MRRIIIIFIILLIVPGASFSLAQDSLKSEIKTVKELTAKFNLSQLSFTNWVQGGENSMAYTAGISGKYEKDYPKLNWLITQEFIFGQTQLGDQGIRNSIDRINIYGNITLKKKILQPYFSVNFLSQFTKGYDYSGEEKIAKSDFWDPAYLTESIGLVYAPSKHFKNQLGVAVKETFTRNFRSYSDDTETENVFEKTLMEPGLNYRADVLFNINKKMEFTSLFEMFSNLSSVEEIDVRWDSKIVMKLSKYIAAEFNLYLLYDKNMLSKTQIKEFLTIGLVYEVFGE